MLLHLILDDKYDVADLIQRNSEEAIEFSHTTDNLTENAPNVIIANISFRRDQLLIAIINVFFKYCSSESVIVHLEGAVAGVLWSTARVVEGWWNMEQH